MRRRDTTGTALSFEFEGQQSADIALEEVASIKRLMREMHQQAKKCAVNDVQQRNKASRDAHKHEQAVRTAKAAIDAVRRGSSTILKTEEEEEEDAQ